MAEAVDLAKLHGTVEVEPALKRLRERAGGSLTVDLARSSPTSSRPVGS